MRLTFCAHSGQLLERSYAPLEFLEFTEPTDTRGDLSKASAFAEQQLAEVGYNLDGDRFGPNRVAEGELVELYRGSTPQDCTAEFAHHLVENEELVNTILNDEVPSEPYYIVLRADLERRYPGARPCVLEHLAELVELFDLCICVDLVWG